MLGHRCENMDGETVGSREVSGDELNPGLHQVRDEGDIPGEAVQLGNYQRRSVNTAGRQRLCKPGAVRKTPAFDFRELLERFFAFQVVRDGFLLGLKPEAATALAGRADPVVGNVSGRLGFGHGCDISSNVGCT